MNKPKAKVFIIFSALLLVALSIHVISLSRYNMKDSSAENIIKASSFIVKDNGTLEQQKTFNLEKFAPGQSTIWNFEIDKTGTDVPVEYIITLEGIGELFEGVTPIKYDLMEGKDNNYTQLTNLQEDEHKYIIIPDKDIKYFAIKIQWPWAAPKVVDKDFIGKSGNIKITVKANQIPN